MLRGDVFQNGFYLRAFWLDKGTARVKTAAGRWIDGGRHFAQEDDFLTVHIGMSR
jgi:hypothetical protein